MLSFSMPAEALSYQFTKLVVEAWAAVCAHTSLNDWLNCTLWEARTGGPEVTVTSTEHQIVPYWSVRYVSWPAAAVHAAPLYPAKITHPELALAPVMRIRMLSHTM